MPIYDYVCGACGHLLEVIHGIHAEGPRYCPSCGAEGRMKKAVVVPAVVYKGSGWAKKDRVASASSGRSKAGESKSSGADEGAAASKPKADGDAGATSATPGSTASGGD